jgi:hypothetical protein
MISVTNGQWQKEVSRAQIFANCLVDRHRYPSCVFDAAAGNPGDNFEKRRDGTGPYGE